MNWREWIAIAAGGILGTVARHACNLAVQRWLGEAWPLATSLVNLVGCFAIGALAQATLRFGWQGNTWEMAIRVGVLGGLTTFSSFGLEVVKQWQSDRPWVAASLVSVQVIGGLVAVILGMRLIEAIFPRL